jgi:hypothetical protein
MKNIISILSISVIFLSLQSCMKDSYTKKTTLYRPLYKSNATIISEIKMEAPQAIKSAGKFAILNNKLYLNELLKGIHVIDISNKTNPVKVGFIPIGGNLDMTLFGNYLYVDIGRDLVTLDLNDNAKVVNRIEKCFGNKWQVPSDGNENVFVGYEYKDTVIVTTGDLSYLNNSGWFLEKDMVHFTNTTQGGVITYSSNSGTGAATTGSMARFTIANNYLYCIDNSNLIAASLANPNAPVIQSTTQVGWTIETVFPFQNNLFIGSTTGMFIYNISTPSSPILSGSFAHVSSCDPVITDGKYAYVTLRSGTACNGFTNQMDVLDITNINAPTLVKSYPMSNPHGLSKVGDYIFLCDGYDGLRTLDASDVKNISKIQTIQMGTTFDVITIDNVAYIVTNEGLKLYDYSNIQSLKLLSIIK